MHTKVHQNYWIASKTLPPNPFMEEIQIKTAVCRADPDFACVC